MKSWLILFHQIPPKPAYFRAKVSRRLVQVGALPLKNSVYVLPDNEDTREDFAWICREIRAEGGAAWLFRANALVGFSDQEAEAAFRQLRDADYKALMETARELDDAELVRRFEAVKSVDFFEHPARRRVEAIVHKRMPGALRSAQVWVTRRGIKVDRIGSAWLIRRFIDPRAEFRFVEPSVYTHTPPELRFDMFEGEFTHEGELCTFEVLVKRNGLLAAHPALQPIGEMIHDIDLKDARYQRPETSGLSRMLDGLCAQTTDDRVRLEKGGAIFDALYESFPA